MNENESMELEQAREQLSELAENEVQEVKAELDEEPEGSSSLVKWILGGAGALVGLGLTGYCWWKRHKNKKKGQEDEIPEMTDEDFDSYDLEADAEELVVEPAAKVDEKRKKK